MSYNTDMKQTPFERCFVEVVEDFARELFQERKKKDEPYNYTSFAKAAYPEQKKNATMTWVRVRSGERGVSLQKANDFAIAVGKPMAELVILAKERLRRGTCPS